MATQSDARLKGQEAGQQVNAALDTAALKLEHGAHHTEDAVHQGQVNHPMSLLILHCPRQVLETIDAVCAKNLLHIE
jgi:hypothetical protein